MEGHSIMLNLKTKIVELRDRGAIFFINHSGGKDSQCMTLLMRELIPTDRLVVVHAHLPEVEWEGTWEHIENTAGNLTTIKVTAVKTFFQMVEHRKKFPSPAQRQCTSDLKRGPIETAIRRYLRKTGNKLIVNCMGMRAQESPNRSRMKVFQLNVRNSKAGREWYDFLPVHKLLENEVFKVIADHGQHPHWAYSKGMTRLSCCFCIMASSRDLKTAARLKPKLYQKYVETEERLNFTVSMSQKFLPEITGISAKEVRNENSPNSMEFY